MDKLIHKYLDRVYILERNDVFYIRKQDCYIIEKYICEDISEAFNISLDDAKKSIDLWAKKQNNIVDLSRYWAATKQRGMVGFPIHIVCLNTPKEYYKKLLQSGTVH